MNEHTQARRDHRFAIGLLTGSVVGAALAIWLSAHVTAAVNELTRKGQDVRDNLADAVARGAHEVERFATAAKSDRVPDASNYSEVDRSASAPRSP